MRESFQGCPQRQFRLAYALSRRNVKGGCQTVESAMQKEFDSIIKNNTWKLVPRPTNAKVIKSRWVYHVKDDDLYKARFCAKGFTQRWGEDYDETFAPVAKYTSIRTLMALLAGRLNVKIHQMDVNTAFLCSDIDEVVYVEQPEGYEISGKEDWVCLLNKALYRLKQSTSLVSMHCPRPNWFRFQTVRVGPLHIHPH